MEVLYTSKGWKNSPNTLTSSDCFQIINLRRFKAKYSIGKSTIWAAERVCAMASLQGCINSALVTSLYSELYLSTLSRGIKSKKRVSMCLGETELMKSWRVKKWKSSQAYPRTGSVMKVAFCRQSHWKYKLESIESHYTKRPPSTFSLSWNFPIWLMNMNGLLSFRDKWIKRWEGSIHESSEPFRPSVQKAWPDPYL